MSRLTIRHGPRATRVWTGPLGDPPPVTAFGPHHGVLPLALEPLSRIGLDGRAWAELSPVLEGMLDGRLGSTPSGELSSTLVEGVARAARAAGVRTYAESLRTALDYTLRIADVEAAAEVELWSVKEGRSSSVWRVSLDQHVIALNVARDDIAAGELTEMGRELIDLHALDPLGVVEVLDIAPDVLACRWLEGRELHVVERGEGRGLFIAVEDSASARGHRLMLMGRQGVPASNMLWSSWLAALVRQSTVDEHGRYHRPRVEVNEGDLMLVNEQPVLVALSPGPVVRSRRGWEQDLLDLRSGERDPVLRWDDRAGAQQALADALEIAAPTSSGTI
ncbi:MAG: hypothetical protein QOC86_2325 [Gaiellales bacterium]|nr:hypothetical protein [Gaiellales bacterium]